MATVSDKKLQYSSNGTSIDYYNPDVVTANDYYPFGSQLPGRKYIQANNTYRYGFNGKEKSDEVYGDGNVYDYGFRIYNPRIGKFLSVDPLSKNYSFYSPYQFAGNNPIEFIDRDGLEPSKNPQFPGLPELYGMFVVGRILRQADKTYHNEESEWFKKEPVIKGVNKTNTSGITNGLPSSITNGVRYVTDTPGDELNLFNMNVSNKSNFYVDESNAKGYDNYERAVTLGLLQNFVSGKGAENYVFPKNGIISSKFLKSDVLKDGLSKYLKNPDQSYSGQSNFGLPELTKDAFKSGTLTGSITGMVGSAFISISPSQEGTNIKIFNITSLYSGTLGKEFISSLSPNSYVRKEGETTSYENISQTFELFIPFNTSSDKFKNLKDVISKGEYKKE